ncbi:hypothetical protein FFZ99_05235 [Leptospira interrogans]|nr:hypothetical protein B2G47_20540 [Leptospira interrogans serovar Canicola]EMJ64134.1 hypothetical protein LEP1GSC197_1230 [Leptospira interrogans serovar Pomona str. CSL4002]EMO01228.1 hypothetical protein LEP1GSC112_1527 [Leptospira interrogans serovar Pomona str. UT364]KYZ63837.1 hypothetical protein AWU66_19120 [Leptospira interrogans serovar Pomona]OQM28822.1 hypothetical protein DV30_16615 [Leptospira interrogans serovar Canicola str. Gui44]OQM29958.1 hypothetical protein DV38_11345 [L
MVFNFIRIDKTISLPDELFLTFLICIATFTTRTHTNNTILKPLSKLETWDLIQKRQRFQVDIIF